MGASVRTKIALIKIWLGYAEGLGEIEDLVVPMLLRVCASAFAVRSLRCRVCGSEFAVESLPFEVCNLELVFWSLCFWSL